MSTPPKDTIQTAEVTELFDPLLKAAPRGTPLLLINEGGVLIKGHWYDGVLAWGYLPRIPKSVKDRMYPPRPAP